ncbi:MAG: tRNA (guanosine(37)-N1)-methyltransferase TrmD [Mariprofundales bacterium]|nr:tRNA (guanosine(37)-N1)-methyltransferase TrmD [Mariprofundales bacterium]
MFLAQILTIFPEFFDSPLRCSIPQRAISNGICSVTCIDIRDFCTDRHHKVDDAPYGGGPGMVMKPEPVVAAIRKARENHADTHVMMLTPDGSPLRQSRLRALASTPGVTLLCGRYEGIDARVEHFVDEKLSLGPFVLSGGEPAALSLLDGIIRLLPGALGNRSSSQQDSFGTTADSTIDWPHYTRPEIFESLRVPSVLLSGDHSRVTEWRQRQAQQRSREYALQQERQ